MFKKKLVEDLLKIFLSAVIDQNVKKAEDLCMERSSSELLLAAKINFKKYGGLKSSRICKQLMLFCAKESTDLIKNHVHCINIQIKTFIPTKLECNVIEII